LITRKILIEISKKRTNTFHGVEMERDSSEDSRAADTTSSSVESSGHYQQQRGILARDDHGGEEFEDGPISKTCTNKTKTANTEGGRRDDVDVSKKNAQFLCSPEARPRRISASKREAEKQKMDATSKCSSSSSSEHNLKNTAAISTNDDDETDVFPPASAKSAIFLARRREAETTTSPTNRRDTENRRTAPIRNMEAMKTAPAGFLAGEDPVRSWAQRKD